MGEPCALKGCTGSATEYPRILIPPKGLYDAAEPIPVVPKLPICESCKPRFDMADILTPDFKEMLRRTLAAAGRATPHFAKARVEWVAIDSTDHPHAGGDSGL